MQPGSEWSQSFLPCPARLPASRSSSSSSSATDILALTSLAICRKSRGSIYILICSHFPLSFTDILIARRHALPSQIATMEINGHASQNGFMASNSPSKVKVAPSRTRPPTVDEALPYSSFSSIIPFDSGTFFSQPPSTPNNKPSLLTTNT